MKNKASKLALGTANFGTKYGVTNLNGKLSDAVIDKILYEMKLANINMIDTAQVYGDSESRLGLSLEPTQKIITKIGVDLEENYHKDYVYNLAIKSIKRLNRNKIYGLLLHRPEVLFGKHGEAIISELNSLKEDGLIEKIGISIYSPDLLSKMISLINLDIIQVPFNIFDQRIMLTGWNQKLKDNGVEIHTRSVFLQGILLLQQNKLPMWFKVNWPKLFNEWFKFQEGTNASADEIALGFAINQPWIDKIVVGVDNEQQLKRIVQIEKANKYNLDLNLSSNDPNLIEPNNWKMT